MLDFSMAHARARDAIHAPLDTATLTAQLEAAGFATEVVTSLARTRAEYLLRPDLGRRMASPIDNAATEMLFTVVIGDGLSSLAPTRHALAVLAALRERVAEWVWDRVFVATQARVALGDGIGQARGAEAVLMLIGERPGLQASDSLGAYLTYRPRVGCTDAERNCVSNIRLGGLGYGEAASRLAWLLREARLLGTSGVQLKDNSDSMVAPSIARTVAAPPDETSPRPTEWAPPA